MMRRVAMTAVVFVVLLAGASPAFAGSAWWGLTSGSWPSNLPQGGTGKVVVTAQNRGYADASGSVTPFVLKDTLPAGLEVLENSKGEPEVESVAGQAPGVSTVPNRSNRGPLTCSSSTSKTVECRFGGTFERKNNGGGTEVVPEILPAGEQLEMRIAVRVAQDASSGEANTVSISGGNAAPQTLTRPLSVGGEPGFGVEDFQLLPEEEGGRSPTQAGVHPFQLTNVLTLNTGEVAAKLEKQAPAGLAKDLRFHLPSGLIGNPTPLPQCTDAQFETDEVVAGSTSVHNKCPAQTAIGVATITYNAGGIAGINLETETVPLFNLTPSAGEPARFGFELALLTRVTLDASVPAGGDYGVTVSVGNIPQSAAFLASKVTFWGVPGDSRHDSERGWNCLNGSSSCVPQAESEPPPFLSLPTSCNGPMRTTVQADSWAEPHPERPFEAPLFSEFMIGGLDGCNRLQFNPEIDVAPDIPNASTPTGLEVKVHVPQTSVLNPESLAESTLRDTTVALPRGVTVNPGGADGLEACSEGQVGFAGFSEFNAAFEAGVRTAVFTPTLPQPFCPNASKVGTAEIETPLLPNELKGAVYLATPAPKGAEEPGRNPFDSLVAMYIVAEDPVSGVLVKLPGVVSLDSNTGQLVSTFTNTPELPFENLRLHFFGESRAPLGTPPLCGPYTTEASFAPWSGNEPSRVSSRFDITSGANGGACQSPLPFAPSLTAGSTNIQAGAFSPFTMTMSREDGNQDLKSIELHMPPGLSGVLAGVPLCGEAQAAAGTCGPGSLIGETTVSVGLGGNPFTVTGGKVYLTGPYEGAPFGLSIVNPAVAGPFNLGKVVVRAKLEVNPTTAAVTVTSDEKGPYAIPPMIDGIPLEIKHVNVTINRPGGFTFNPTSCAAMAITGTLHSIEGATQTLPVPFQATNCAVLKFAPKFAVTTSGKTSKANGASLHVKLTYPKAPQGTQANIARVKVDLPKQLPSRLTTLQKACTAAQFAVNPAGCPAASIIGHAKAITPLLPVPLEGPAYFVSHGGEAFPSLIMVLQGYGVTLDLVGTTFISKAGITSSTFKTVPDAPVGSFELTLPQGKYSALAANGNLCKSKLAMPTGFVAQNGQKVSQITKIAVTGCPKIKKAKRKTKKIRKRAKANGKRTLRLNHIQRAGQEER